MPPGSGDTPCRRLFFALWPDEGLAREFHHCGAGLTRDGQGRRLPWEKLHLTLAFLGPCSEEQQACVEALAESIQLPPFTITMDRLGHWPKPQVVWLGAKAPDPLKQLVAAINRGLPACGLRAENRPYVPHMTLLRKRRRAPDLPEVEPIDWAVRDFCLAVSESLPEGVRYRVLRRWGLKQLSEI